MVHSLIKTQGRALEHLFLRYANPSISKIHHKLGHKHARKLQMCSFSYFVGYVFYKGKRHINHFFYC